MHIDWQEQQVAPIWDFLGVVELRIVNEVTFPSTLERLGEPKLAVKTIEQECQKQLGGLLPILKWLCLTRKLLTLALDNAFYSQRASSPKKQLPFRSSWMDCFWLWNNFTSWRSCCHWHWIMHSIPRGLPFQKIKEKKCSFWSHHIWKNQCPTSRW